MRPSVAVFGAAGFTGALSAKILHGHPSFELRFLTARSEEAMLEVTVQYVVRRTNARATAQFIRTV